MNKIILLVISMFSILNIFTAQAQTWVTLENKSIKEIKQDIEKLHIDRNTLNNQFTILTQNNNFVSYLVKNDYFRTNINWYELDNIEKLITWYNENYIKINNQLLDKAKNLEDIYDEKIKLLTIKKDLYQSLIQYIKPSQYQDYLVFIKWDAKIIKEDIDVKWKLVSNKKLLSRKVTLIEERIQVERKRMSVHLKESISVRIDEKIKLISQNEKFLKLSTELQAQVIQKTINKVENAIIKIEEKLINDNILSQKIEIYEILHKKLIDYYHTLNIKKEWE